MKKGCFFGLILFLTIAIGVGLYLYKKYFPQIKSYGKEKIIQLSMKEINKKIDKVKESEYKDSLKIYLDDQLRKFNKDDYKDSFNKFGKIIDQVKNFIDDGEIDSVEFIALKNMAIKNERPEKNRN